MNLNNDADVFSGQSWLALSVWLSGLLSQHIVDPSAVWLDDFTALAHLSSHVHESQAITNGANFVRDVVLGKVGHALIEILVSPEVEQVTGDSVRVADFDEVTGLAVLDLEWDTTGTSGDDWNTLVESLRDLDLKPFTTGKLEGDLAAREESVEDWKP